MKTQKRKMYTYLWRMKIKKIIFSQKISRKQYFSFFLCVSTINNQQMSLLHTKQFNVPLPALTFMLKRVTYAYWNPDDVAQVCCLDRDKIIASYEILSIALNLLKCGIKWFLKKKYFMFLYLVFGFFGVPFAFSATSNWQCHCVTSFKSFQAVYKWKFWGKTIEAFRKGSSTRYK